MLDVFASNEAIHRRARNDVSHPLELYAQIALDQSGVSCVVQHETMQWHIVKSPSDVPEACDVRLAVITKGEVHALVFPCRRVGLSYLDAKTNRPVEVHPTHWQQWAQDAG
jgi:hypothetical protein